MRITIDTHAATPAEMGILIATLVACGASVPDVARGVARDTPMREALQSNSERLKIADSVDLRDVSFGKIIKFVVENRFGFAIDELNLIIASLNEELYSRRISAADNPEAGADTALTHETKVTVKIDAPPGLDLASVFGGGQKPNDADIAGENQQSTNEQSSLDPLHKLVVEKTDREMLGTVALDKAGIPWDSRIHSASKAINQTDGLWRQKRGVAPDLVATVVAQLKQAQSVPAVGGIDPASTHTDSDASVIVKIPPPPATTSGTGVPPPPSTDAAPADTGQIDSLPRLLKFITEQKLAGKINQAQVQQALISLGIEGPLPVLGSRPDLIPEMVKKLKLIGGIE